MSTSLFGVGASINVNVNGTLVPQSFIGSAGQVLFTITNFTYVPGTNSLIVFINGTKQVVGRDYTETSATSFTLVEGVILGDNVDIIGFPQTTLNSVPVGSINVQRPDTGVVVRTLQNKLLDMISVKDFGALADGVTDDTASINAAFEYARINGRFVYVPAGGYLVTNLIYGTQNNSGQSNCPLGIYGEGYGSVFVQKAGTTGTVLAAIGVGGNVLSNFAINANGNTGKCIDTSWNGGAGPSLQNRYEYIRCSGSTITAANGGIWNCVNNNDCEFFKCVVNASSLSQICFNLNASGGLGQMEECIWNGGYLKIGVQNGSLINCWGHGIMFAQGSLNYLTIMGGYIYSNGSLGCILKSESFASSASIKALTCLSTQFIADNSITSIANLNLYSNCDFLSCQFFMAAAQNLFGTSTRSDSFAVAKCMLRGGSAATTLTLNDVGGVVVEARGFMNDNTGANFNKNWAGSSTIAIAGATTAGTAAYTNNTLTWIREGNLVFFQFRLTWSAATGTGNMTVTGFPFSSLSQQGAHMAFPGSTFSGAIVYPNVVGAIMTFLAASGANYSMNATGDIIVSGVCSVLAA